MKKLGLGALTLAGAILLGGCSFGKDTPSYYGEYEFEYIELLEEETRYYSCNVDREFEFKEEITPGGLESTISFSCSDFKDIEIEIDEYKFEIGSDKVDYLMDNNEIWLKTSETGAQDATYQYYGKYENGKLHMFSNKYYKVVFSKK